MNSKQHLLRNVIEDRKEGFSLSDLSKKYGISKSTASLWCKDLEISPEIKSIVKEKWLKNTKANRAKAAIRNRQKKIDRVENEYLEAKNKIGGITDRDLLIIGVGLYWAEGSKKEHGGGFSFINSDHTMIKLIHRWLIEIIKIEQKQLIINVAINVSHKERETEILKFWSNLLDFPLGDFGNTTFIKTPHRRIYSNHLNYFGMLRIKVRSSAWLRRRVLGMIKIFTENMPA